mgnify:CR=1 FL=1
MCCLFDVHAIVIFIHVFSEKLGVHGCKNLSFSDIFASLYAWYVFTEGREERAAKMLFFSVLENLDALYIFNEKLGRNDCELVFCFHVYEFYTYVCML